MIPLLYSLSCTQGDIGLIYFDKDQDDTSNSVSQVDSSDPQDTNSSVDTGISQNPNGVSGYFTMYLQQISCPPCFGLNREITTEFSGFFHETISDSHFAGSLEPGQCTTVDYSYRPSYNLLNHSNKVSLSGNQYSFDVFASQMQFYTGQIYESQVERDTLYSVATDQGNFSFYSIHGFDFIEPYDMLYVDPSYAFAAPISSSGQTFSWGPSGSDSLFEISLEVFSYDGSQFLGLVTCAGNDSGFMNIPGNYISSFPQGSLVAIILTRHKRESSIYPPLNSYIETHMRWQVVGTGYIY